MGGERMQWQTWEQAITSPQKRKKVIEALRWGKFILGEDYKLKGKANYKCC